MKIGVLHPGKMGVSVARTMLNGGHEVYWAGHGRSQATADRAKEHGLTDVGTLAALCEASEIVFSICPPEAASALAEDVKATGFRGTFVDANAISPERMRAIEASLTAAGISVVDGGIIGHPAWKPGTTWLYLSGPEARTACAAVEAGPLHGEVLDDIVGTASALKMCYAALTKGTTALLCAILGSAEELGVRAALNNHWERDGAGLAEQREMAIRNVTTKAWRYGGEMREIASTFENAGLPGGIHAAAADIFDRLAQFKDGPHPTPLQPLLKALRKPN